MKSGSKFSDIAPFRPSKLEEDGDELALGGGADPDRIQSKDLPESSAQKASSVSPAHFRSALVRARRLMAQTQGDSGQSPSPSPAHSAGSGSGSGSRRSSPRKSTTQPGTRGGGPSIDPLSPFQTPKKKFKYSSGIDVSDLLRSGGQSYPHTPTTGSPLRQSQTPGTGTGTGTASRASAREGKEGVERTPTKRTKFHPRGVDLSTANLDIDVDVDAEEINREEGGRRSRRKNDMSAFMALRPGSAGSTSKTTTTPVKDANEELPEEEQEYLRSIRQKRHTARDTGRRRTEVKRRDWTCREVIWGSGIVDRQNRIELDRVSGWSGVG